MARFRGAAILISLGSLLSCHRLDTLTVIENPNGPGVVVDNLYGRDQRVICVLAQATDDCSKDDASVVVAEVTNPGDVRVGWTGADGVRVDVAHGRVIRAAASALSGRVKISVRA